MESFHESIQLCNRKKIFYQFTCYNMFISYVKPSVKYINFLHKRFPIKGEIYIAKGNSYIFIILLKGCTHMIEIVR